MGSEISGGGETGRQYELRVGMVRSQALLRANRRPIAQSARESEFNAGGMNLKYHR